MVLTMKQIEASWENQDSAHGSDDDDISHIDSHHVGSDFEREEAFKKKREAAREEKAKSCPRIKLEPPLVFELPSCLFCSSRQLLFRRAFIYIPVRTKLMTLKLNSWGMPIALWIRST